MLATAPGCQFEVDRGPDWLLVRLRKLEADCSGLSRLADHMWQLLEQHFTYRLVLELDNCRAGQHLDRTIDPVVQTDQRARRCIAIVRRLAL